MILNKFVDLESIEVDSEGFIHILPEMELYNSSNGKEGKKYIIKNSDLSGFDFTNMDITSYVFIDTNLSSCIFLNTIFEFGIFTRCDLSNTKIINSCGYHSVFEDSNFDSVQIANSDLSEVCFYGNNTFSNMSFLGSNLSEVVFEKYSNLQNVMFMECIFLMEKELKM